MLFAIWPRGSLLFINKCQLKSYNTRLGFSAQSIKSPNNFLDSYLHGLGFFVQNSFIKQAYYSTSRNGLYDPWTSLHELTVRPTLISSFWEISFTTLGSWTMVFFFYTDWAHGLCSFHMVGLMTHILSLLTSWVPHLVAIFYTKWANKWKTSKLTFFTSSWAWFDKI